jgi:hypothetical protein
MTGPALKKLAMCRVQGSLTIGDSGTPVVASTREPTRREKELRSSLMLARSPATRSGAQKKTALVASSQKPNRSMVMPSPRFIPPRNQTTDDPASE